MLQLCPTLRPHRQQPTRLRRLWDSPGKNTGVGCHFLLQCMKVKSESEVAQSCLTLATPWTEAHQTPSSMGSSRQEYWSGCHCLFRRNNPSGYQMVRTHTKETTVKKTQRHPTTNSTLCRMPQTKYKPNHQQTGLPPHSVFPIRGKANKQKLNTNFTL